VLHCVREWGSTEHDATRDLISTTTATIPIVVCGVDHERDGRRPNYTLDRLLPPPLRGRDRTASRAMTAVARRHGVSIIHQHLGDWAGVAVATAGAARRPLVVSLGHADLLGGSEVDVRLRDADAVIVPSDLLASVAADRGFAAERISVIPSGVDLARLRYRERRPDPGGEVVVTLVGSFDEQSRAEAADHALDDLKRRHPHVRFEIVGYAQAATALDRSHIVVTACRGGIDHDADARRRVEIAAQACGIPVVTWAGAAPEHVAHGAGQFVSEHDERGLCNGLDALLAQPDMWPSMGRAGRRHVALNFELGATTARTEDLYRAVIAGRQAPADRRQQRKEWPSITVVVPSADRRDLLREALASLAVQTYPNDKVDVIVVDDGSRDGTVEMLDTVESPISMQVLRNETRTGAAAARNRGVAAASGAIVAFIDSDCRAVPTWLETMAASMRDGVDVVQGVTTADPDEPLEPLSRTQWVPYEYGLYESCNIAYRRSLLDRLGSAPFRTEVQAALRGLVGRDLATQAFGEDTDLGWRARRVGARTSFSATGIVHHHVFPPDARYLFRRSVLAAGFPQMVRWYPELRDTFLWHRFFLHARRPMVVVGTIGLVLGLRRRRYLALAVPWLVGLVDPGRPGWRARLRTAPVRVACDWTETAALAYGSVRTRTPVF